MKDDNFIQKNLNLLLGDTKRDNDGVFGFQTKDRGDFSPPFLGRVQQRL